MHNKKGIKINRLTSQSPACPLENNEEEESACREGEEELNGKEDMGEDNDGEEGEPKEN